MTRVQNIKPLVFIGGMAHSGTTALAQHLGLTPGWSLHVSANRLESAELINRDAAAIREIAAQSPGVTVMKAPWIERDHEWFAREFPSASYFIMIRSFSKIRESWARDAQHYVNLRERCSNWKGMVDLYQEFVGHVTELMKSVKRVALIEHSLLCQSRGLFLNEILEKWELPVNPFDSATIDPEKA